MRTTCVCVCVCETSRERAFRKRGRTERDDKEDRRKQLTAKESAEGEQKSDDPVQLDLEINSRFDFSKKIYRRTKCKV